MSFVTRGGIALPPGPVLGKRTRQQSSPERATSTLRELTPPKTSRVMPLPEADITSRNTGQLDLAHTGDLGLALSQMRQTQQLLHEAIQLQAYRGAFALRRLRELADLDLAKFGVPPPVSRPSMGPEFDKEADKGTLHRLQGTVAERPVA